MAHEEVLSQSRLPCPLSCKASREAVTHDENQKHRHLRSQYAPNDDAKLKPVSALPAYQDGWDLRTYLKHEKRKGDLVVKSHGDLERSSGSVSI